MRSQAQILLVEDSDEDYEATRRALGRCARPPQLLRCADADEAMAYLRTQSGPPGAARPAVILLDLNLPGTGGRELLEEIKRDEGLRHFPVVILTTSANVSDVAFCYRTGASGYILKPLDFDGFSRAIQEFCAYWFEAVVLPEEAPAE